MLAWKPFCTQKLSREHTGRKESTDPTQFDRIIGENQQPTLRRHYDPVFNTHPPFEGDIEDKLFFEPDPDELAHRIIRAVTAGEWASQAGVDDEERLAICAALGIRIGAMRRGCGVSLDELALCTGMDADVLFAIELGLVSAAQVAQHLERIAEALGDPEGELRTMLMQFYPIR